MAGIGGKVLGAIGLSPATYGPLSGQGDLILRGRMLADRLATGLVQGQGQVGAAMSQLLNVPTADVSAAVATQRGGGGGGPVIHIENANFSDNLDLEAFMRKAAWVAQTSKL
jgi:hypothetical protein